MYKTEIISKFGGINKLKDAIKTKSLDDVYCWENGNWYTQRYWIDIASKNLTGETLLDLMTGIPLDATHDFLVRFSLKRMKKEMFMSGCQSQKNGYM